jgi:hypothetical protein
VPTYVLGTFYIRFFCYQGYDIPVSGEAHCTNEDGTTYLVQIMYIVFSIIEGKI